MKFTKKEKKKYWGIGLLITAILIVAIFLVNPFTVFGNYGSYDAGAWSGSFNGYEMVVNLAVSIPPQGNDIAQSVLFSMPESISISKEGCLLVKGGYDPEQSLCYLNGAFPNEISGNATCTRDDGAKTNTLVSSTNARGILISTYPGLQLTRLPNNYATGASCTGTAYFKIVERPTVPQVLEPVVPQPTIIQERPIQVQKPITPTTQENPSTAKTDDFPLFQTIGLGVFVVIVIFLIIRKVRGK